MPLCFFLNSDIQLCNILTLIHHGVGNIQLLWRLVIIV